MAQTNATVSTRCFNCESLEEMSGFQFESDPTKKSTGTWTEKRHSCVLLCVCLWGRAVALPFATSLVRHLVYQRLRGRLGVALGAFRTWLIAVDGSSCWVLLTAFRSSLVLIGGQMTRVARDQTTRAPKTEGRQDQQITGSIKKQISKYRHKKIVEKCTSR